MTQTPEMDIGSRASRRSILRWRSDPARYGSLLGRVLYSVIFLLSGWSHFSRQTIRYARQKGVPLAGLLVPLSGAMAIAGGLSVLLGLRARAGAALLTGFLVPVTFKMHGFWSIRDPWQRRQQQIHFMKNLCMVGGALLLSYHGTGSLSMDRLLGDGRWVPRATIL